ncbi:MAG: hypothetical protein ACKOA1_09870 [Bacteroidota bacterium]
MIRILEMAWLAIAILSGAISAFQFFVDGWQSALWMIFITAVAAVMYIIRRRQRIAMEDRSH